jgi:phasin
MATAPKTPKAPAAAATAAIDQMAEATKSAIEKFSAFELPKFDPAQFDMSKFEVPAALRDAAEKTITQAKESYAKLKQAAEEATDLVEDTYTTATKGANEFNLKALDSARTNINSAFDFAREILAVKNVSEAVELHTAYIRKQFDAIQSQTQALSGIAQKVATETTEPVKETVQKALKLNK